MRPLFIVEAVFVIRDLAVLVPGLGREDAGLRLGSDLELRLPDGAVIRTRLAAINMLYPNPRSLYPIAVPLKPAEIPAGTVVWA